MIKSFRDLEAWKKAHDLAIDIYKVTEDFPQKEQFGLSSQMRRAAVSISSNIAEGFSRISLKEKIHFYSIAHGSNTELQAQILIAKDVDLLTHEAADNLLTKAIEVHKILTGLLKSTRLRAN